MAMRIRTLLLSAMLALSVGGPAYARYHPQALTPSWVMPAQGQGDHRQQRQIRSLREVVDEIRSRHGGDLISARLEDGSRPTYVLRWRLPDGQVRDFRVSAER